MRDLEQFADIIVDISTEALDRTFQYKVPEEMQGKIRPGVVVEVPFGKGNRPTKAYVIEVTKKPAFDPDRQKYISRILTDGLGEEERLVSLAAMIREHYGSTMAQALRTVIPVRRKVRNKEKLILTLKVDRQEGEGLLAQMRRKHQTARARLLETLLEEPVLPFDLVRDKRGITMPTVRALEAAGILAVTAQVCYRNPAGTVQASGERLQLKDQQRRIVDEITGNWDQDPRIHGRYLIQGVTGSGKTAVYMELIAYALERGEQAIMLIPEIALTWQTVLRLSRRFGEKVSFINSRLSEGERYDQFERAKKGEVEVMVGPRSALFTPFPNLGLIVIDEEQEGAYQSENIPRYHAREVAVMRAGLEGARLVLGSATPSLEARYAAQCGRYSLLRLDERINAGALPQTQIVDLRAELKAGNRSMISRLLHQKMEEALERQEQIMLFINRRGYAGFVSCRSCGEVLKCPHCDVSLTLHRNGTLVCHYCGYQIEQQHSCPSCGSPFLRSFKAGTQQIEEDVASQFPAARILRMDLDTTRGKDSHASILSAFAGHEADILIGTQMIVKGHDFPDVTLVGILAADLSLFAPDYRSGERTFQLRTQAAGRAGRAQKSGQVVIQTYAPDHPVIERAALQDYDSFYEQEIALRLAAGYPPAGTMCAIHVTGEDPLQLETAMEYLRRFLELARRSCLGPESKAASRDAEAAGPDSKAAGPAGEAGREPVLPSRKDQREYAAADREKERLQILGPVDETVAKIQDRYRKVIYIKSDDQLLVRQIRGKTEEYIAMNAGFASLLIQFELM